VATFRELFQKQGGRSFKKFIEADARFHETIISVTKNRKLWKLFNYIRNSERLLMIPSAKIEGRMETAVDEHLCILDAIEKKDLDLAIKCLSDHIKEVKNLLLHIHAKPNEVK
jgi:DNA-binding GntR family transcriptional regulator